MNDEISYHGLSPENAALLETTDVFDHAVDPAQLAAFLSSPGHELVFARMGSRVVGIASGTVLLHPDKQPAFFIAEVGVSEDLRQRGIATALCEALIQVVREKGYRGIWLATEDDNAAARALYRKLGARETSGIVVYDWDGAMDA